MLQASGGGVGEGRGEDYKSICTVKAKLKSYIKASKKNNRNHLIISKFLNMKILVSF